MSPGSEPFRGLRGVNAHPFPRVGRGARPGLVLQRGRNCRVKVNAGETVRALRGLVVVGRTAHRKGDNASHAVARGGNPTTVRDTSRRPVTSQFSRGHISTQIAAPRRPRKLHPLTKYNLPIYTFHAFKYEYGVNIFHGKSHPHLQKASNAKSSKTALRAIFPTFHPERRALALRFGNRARIRGWQDNTGCRRRNARCLSGFGAHRKKHRTFPAQARIPRKKA